MVATFVSFLFGGIDGPNLISDSFRLGEGTSSILRLLNAVLPFVTLFIEVGLGAVWKETLVLLSMISILYIIEFFYYVPLTDPNTT